MPQTPYDAAGVPYDDMISYVGEVITNEAIVAGVTPGASLGDSISVGEAIFAPATPGSSLGSSVAVNDVVEAAAMPGASAANGVEVNEAIQQTFAMIASLTAQVFAPTPDERTFEVGGTRNNTFLKDPDATLDYRIDWSGWLGQDTIDTSIVAVSTGLTLSMTSHDEDSTTLWLSGGALGREYAATNRITTAAGRTADRTLIFKIRTQ